MQLNLLRSILESRLRILSHIVLRRLDIKKDSGSLSTLVYPGETRDVLYLAECTECLINFVRWRSKVTPVLTFMISMLGSFGNGGFRGVGRV